MRRIPIFFLCLLFVQESLSQNPASLSNLRKKVIHTQNTVEILDTVSIVPGTVVVQGATPDQYMVDAINFDRNSLWDEETICR